MTCATSDVGTSRSKKSVVDLSQESLESLKALKAEQARLKAEYEKMEVRNIDSRLRSKCRT